MKTYKTFDIRNVQEEFAQRAPAHSITPTALSRRHLATVQEVNMSVMKFVMFDIHFHQKEIFKKKCL